MTELATGNHKTLQIRFGIHPGVKNVSAYLQTLLATCQKFPETQSQFKIILPSGIKQKLDDPAIYSDNPFFLHEEINGSMAAGAADGVTQAVPGAQLNEAAIRGKAVYIHQKVTPYLPPHLFTSDLPTFFVTKRRDKCSKAELGIADGQEDAPTSIASMML